MKNKLFYAFSAILLLAVTAFFAFPNNISSLKELEATAGASCVPQAGSLCVNSANGTAFANYALVNDFEENQ